MTIKYSTTLCMLMCIAHALVNAADGGANRLGGDRAAAPSQQAAAQHNRNYSPKQQEDLKTVNDAINNHDCPYYQRPCNIQDWIEHSKLHPDDTYYGGQRSLFDAIAGKNICYFEFLLQHGASPNLPLAQGVPPAFLVLELIPAFLDSLIEHGANITVKYDGQTFLQHLIHKAQVIDFRYPEGKERFFEKARLLIFAGVPLDNWQQTLDTLFQRLEVDEKEKEIVWDVLRQLEAVIEQAINERSAREKHAQLILHDNANLPKEIASLVTQYAISDATSPPELLPASATQRNYTPKQIEMVKDLNRELKKIELGRYRKREDKFQKRKTLIVHAIVTNKIHPDDVVIPYGDKLKEHLPVLWDAYWQKDFFYFRFLLEHGASANMSLGYYGILLGGILHQTSSSFPKHIIPLLISRTDLTKKNGANKTLLQEFIQKVASNYEEKDTEELAENVRMLILEGVPLDNWEETMQEELARGGGRYLPTPEEKEAIRATLRQIKKAIAQAIDERKIREIQGQLALHDIAGLPKEMAELVSTYATPSLIPTINEIATSTVPLIVAACVSYLQTQKP